MDSYLPLVSVVVVNHNYGRFLRATLDSIYAQNYPRIECIVVDNASTDNSADVIREVKAAHSDLVDILLPKNIWQSGASKKGFNASHGDYVVFVDADDWMLPDFVRTHVFVHLSSRIHIGMTSSDILQVVNGRMVLATGQALSDYVRSGAGRHPDLARPVTESLPSLACFTGFDTSVVDRLHYVQPGTARWVWSPTSANFFRRDALDLIMRSSELDSLEASTDVFVCVGVSGMCGSMLIDRALTVYRVHGDNFGAGHAQLNGIRAMKDGSDMTVPALSVLIDYFVSNKEFLESRCWDKQTYQTLVDNMIERRSEITPAVREWHASPDLVAAWPRRES